jgi:hypothetical protein
MRIMVINNVSERDQLRHYAQELTYGFELLGHEVEELDIGRPAHVLETSKVVEAFKPDWFFSIDAGGYQFDKLGARSLLDAERPLFTLLLDEAVLLGERLAFATGPHVYVGFHSERARRSGVGLGVPLGRSAVVPVAGHAAPPISDEERTFDIVYAGHFVHPDRILAQCERLLMPALFKLFAAVSEHWFSNLASSPYTLLDALLADLGVELKPEELAEIQPVVIGNAIRYVRSLARGRLMKALAQLPLTVAGSGWEAVLGGTTARLLPALRFHHAQELLKRGKLALNLMPLSTDGPGVRAWDTTLHGAVLVSTPHAELEQHLVPEEDYVPIGSEAVDACAARISKLLSNASERQRMSESARLKSQGETWEARAAHIVELMQLRDSTSQRVPPPYRAAEAAAPA